MTRNATLVPDRADDARSWVLAMHLCYLLPLWPAGVVIAYLKRAEFAGTAWESHATYAIRTFWIALAGAIVGLVLILLLVGLAILSAVALWVVARAAFGVTKALAGRPIARPATWLV